MKVLRTPDDRFAELPDFPFEPNYRSFRTGRTTACGFIIRMKGEDA